MTTTNELGQLWYLRWQQARPRITSAQAPLPALWFWAEP